MPEGAQEEIALVMSDPEIAPLMKRFVNGDTSVADQLHALIVQRKASQ